MLLTVNKLRIASVTAIHEETGFPKSTIVRMLETLRTEGYVARDNMCGGYRVTSRVQKLNSGYQGISQVIEVARRLNSANAASFVSLPASTSFISPAAMLRAMSTMALV